jgi:hypothetical protein
MAKKTTGKKESFGADLIAGMKTVLAHQRGEIEIEQVWPATRLSRLRMPLRHSEKAGGRSPRARRGVK